jgi:hypothetical protein
MRTLGHCKNPATKPALHSSTLDEPHAAKARVLQPPGGGYYCSRGLLCKGMPSNPQIQANTRTGGLRNFRRMCQRKCRQIVPDPKARPATARRRCARPAALPNLAQHSATVTGPTWHNLAQHGATVTGPTWQEQRPCSLPTKMTDMRLFFMAVKLGTQCPTMYAK